MVFLLNTKTKLYGYFLETLKRAFLWQDQWIIKGDSHWPWVIDHYWAL